MFTELEINFREADYSFTEGSPDRPRIELQFRQAQDPFTVTLYPVSITEALDPAGFNTSAFISAEDISEATPGKGVVESAAVVGINVRFPIKGTTVRCLVKAMAVHYCEMPS